ncbi:MAG: HPr family phosphocarrier protein [Clostridia bacterium]|nr:HPr family phosphocarrier protein [Clostridia bacterium]
MKSFSYVIKDKVGIHARPAGLLAKEAKNFKSEIIIEKDGKYVNVQRLMQVMGMGIKCGDTVNVKINGIDEEDAARAMESFFSQNL